MWTLHGSLQRHGQFAIVNRCSTITAGPSAGNGCTARMPSEAASAPGTNSLGSAQSRCAFLHGWDTSGWGSGFQEGAAERRWWVSGERLLTCWDTLGAAQENLSNGHFGKLAEIGLKVLGGHQVIQVDGLPLAWRGKRTDQSTRSLLVHQPSGKPGSLAAQIYQPNRAGRRRETEDPPLHMSSPHVFILPSHPFADPKEQV